MGRREIDWAGIAAAVLAVGVVAVLVVGEVLAYLNTDKLVSTEEVATISTVLGAAVGAVAGYVGARVTPRPRRPPDPPEDPPEELRGAAVRRAPRLRLDRGVPPRAGRARDPARHRLGRR